MFQLFIRKSINRAWEVLWTASARAVNSHTISDDVWLDSLAKDSHLSHNEKSLWYEVHIYAFIMLILQGANKINTFK